MSANKPNISQIRKYLNGELDARAMYELERQAQDDPFLMDVIKGMESSDEDHQPKLDDIDRLISARVEQDKRRTIVPWKLWSVAASLIIALSIGGWLFTRQPAKNIVATNTKPVVQPDKVEVAEPPAIKPALTAVKPNLIAENPHSKIRSSVSGAPVGINKSIVKEDTTEYKASAYSVKINNTTDGLLKKRSGFKVDSNGNVTSQGAAVAKIRLNGKAYSMPNDIVEPIQVIDDYGDQASKSKSMLAYKTITGKVVDKANNTPLPGVAILIRGSNKIVMSDTSGKFSIKVPAKKDTLDIRYIGYEQQQVKIKDRDNLKIALEPSNRSLNEVVIVGYGTQKKTTLTGSVSSVSSVYAKQATDTTVNQALMGKLAGVNIDKSVKVITGVHPQIGWEAYRKYISDNATMPNGKTGSVRLSFTIDAKGAISNIRIIKSSSNEMNQKAISLIQNGPKWFGNRNGLPEEIKLKIRFH